MKHFLILSVILLAVNAQEIAFYEEIKDLPNHPHILLIDVREISEIGQTGLIPTSINIPCKFFLELKSVYF
jgi:rhodanese-related sulfurtransferase